VTTKKSKPTSPTARTLVELRKRGLYAQVVERWNQYARVRIDLFGVIDVVVIGDGAIIGIQATTTAHAANRIDKILAEPRALAWLRAGGRIELWSWAKRGAAGTRKLWTLRVEAITVDMFERRERDLSITHTSARGYELGA
jgi:hypothetical protein